MELEDQIQRWLNSARAEPVEPQDFQSGISTILVPVEEVVGGGEGLDVRARTHGRGQPTMPYFSFSPQVGGKYHFGKQQESKRSREMYIVAQTHKMVFVFSVFHRARCRQANPDH